MFIEEIDAHDESYVKDSLTKTHQDIINDYSDYDYSIEDCVLVRTTNHFPFGGVIKTPINAYAVAKFLPCGMDEAIKSILETIEEDKREEILNRLKVNQRVLRNTTHFAINGLVSSHMYGNFDSRPFIIIEPLKYHINSESLQSLRVEDTYFDDNIVLSTEATIIIRSDIYNQIKDDDNYKEELSRYRIYTYSGSNEKKAISEVLNKNGYDSFVVNDHGYSNGLYDEKPASKMYSFINQYRKNNNIGSEKHFYSKNREEVVNAMKNEALSIAYRIIEEMCKELHLESEQKELCRIVRKEYYLSKEENEYLKSFILRYGFDNFVKLIERINVEFNQELLEEKNSQKSL